MSTPDAPPLSRFRIHGTVAKCFRSGRFWFVQIEGSWESLCLGEVQSSFDLSTNEFVAEPPPFAAGDPVDIVIERRK